MRRKVAILTIAAIALVPVFMVSPPSAGATNIQGCVHWNESQGPYGAFVVDAYNRCNGVTIRRKPDIVRGADGVCKTMIPNHHYQWQLWDPVRPSVHQSRARLDLVLIMAARRLMPRQSLAIAGVIGLLMAIPVPRAMAHDYCVSQGYDHGCVTNDHSRWTACDAEKDGQRVYAEAWDRTPQGYYDIQTVWDPDGAGGKCGVAVRGHIDRLKVCETGPSGLFCAYGP